VPVTRQQFLPDARQISNGVIVNQTGWQQSLETNKQNFFADFVTASDFLTSISGIDGAAVRRHALRQRRHRAQLGAQSRGRTQRIQFGSS
jgi:hypothetical protein